MLCTELSKGLTSLNFVNIALCIICRAKEKNEELEKEHGTLSTEVSKLKLNESEENERLKNNIREVESKFQECLQELDASKEKLQAHDQAAKRAIAALQKEMALRVDQVCTHTVLSPKKSKFNSLFCGCPVRPSRVEISLLGGVPC